MAAELEKPTLIGEPVQKPDGDVLEVEEWSSTGDVHVTCGGVGAYYTSEELSLLGNGRRSHGINRIAQAWYKADRDELWFTVGGRKVMLEEIVRLKKMAGRQF